MKKILLLTISILVFSPIFAFASGDLVLDIVGDVKPNTSVVVRLSSPYKDLGGTDIMWLENGELREDGVGLLNHRIYLGNFGETITVTAILAIPGSRGELKESITISPAELDIIWEAQTATPPFYRGKALPSHESLIKVIAIPNFGKRVKSKDVTYSWKKNKTISIGDGLNVIGSAIFGAWENTSTNIEATAKNLNQTAAAEIKIPSFKPSILFYEVSPTQGILTQEILNNSPIRNSVELSLLAVPFGIANSERNKSQVLYEWNAGNSKIKEGQGNIFETISLSRSDSSLKKGEINISLLAQNMVNVMQFSKNSFSWKFTDK